MAVSQMQYATHVIMFEACRTGGKDRIKLQPNFERVEADWVKSSTLIIEYTLMERNDGSTIRTYLCDKTSYYFWLDLVVISLERMCLVLCGVFLIYIILITVFLLACDVWNQKTYVSFVTLNLLLRWYNVSVQIFSMK